MNVNRGTGPRLWIHCADPSLTAALPALEASLDEAIGPLVGTASGCVDFSSDAPLTPVLLDNGAPAGIRRHLTSTSPDLLILLGSPLPDALLGDVVGSGCPVLVMASHHPPFASRLLAVPGRRARLLNRCHRICVPDASSAQAFRRAGAEPARIEVTGPLRATAKALPCNEADRDDLARIFDGRPAWLAVDVLPADLPLIAAAQHQAAIHSHRLLLIVRAADPADGPELAAALRELGLSTALRSEGQEPTGSVQAYVADLEGEAGLWYRLAPVSFMCASFGPRPGRPPFEPAALGSAIAHGPHTAAHAEQYERLRLAHATCVIDHPDALPAAIDSLTMPARAANLAQAAWAECTDGAQAIARLTELAAELLD